MNVTSILHICQRYVIYIKPITKFQKVKNIELSQFRKICQKYEFFFKPLALQKPENTEVMSISLNSPEMNFY